MLFQRKPSLEERVLELLKEGPVQAHQMVEYIQRVRTGTTKQGVYSAIRELKADEIVVMNKGMVSLNIAWLSKMEAYVSTAAHKHQQDTGIGGVLSLAEGDKAHFHFGNPVSADIFWNHLLYLLVEFETPGEPFVSYNPHVWFYLAHPKQERELHKKVHAHGRQYLVTAGYKTQLDQAIRQEFSGDMSQYHLSNKPLFKKTNYHLNIIGDVLIEVWIEPKMSLRIHNFYKTHSKLSPETYKKFKDIVADPGKTRIAVSRNAQRAARLKKKVLKPFYIPKKRAKK